jgi:Calcineurin-like phosphoesterase
MAFKRRRFLILAGLSGLGAGVAGYGLRSLADVNKDKNKFNPSPETTSARDNGANPVDLGPLQLRFVATADTGSGDKNQFAVGRAMEQYRQRSPFNLAILGGDNIYNSGEMSKIKAVFEDPYADLLKAGVKFRACLGNHDTRTEQGNPQVAYPGFNMDSRYYTFSQGPAQFFVLDLNVDIKWDEQISWLNQQLKASKAAWKIVYSHFPIYSSGHYGTSPNMVKLFTPIFKEHGVNLYINGHEHHYERTRPIDGTTYLITGHGGASLRKVGKSDFTEFSISRFGFSSIELYAKAMVIQGIGTDGKVFDRGVIKV